MSETKNDMVINYVPGEECRVAVIEDGKLEEFHAERADAVSHVGNIYVGKVRNVEPAIQAAFVDFGLEQNGFLHVSDLHPQYFPGEGDETTEMVGKKTPRRERPPIQECLRRGQEIAVQVLKEGVGTKGPTVTSYLSIPGRFLVMMPNMDRVGVSRKVEDEETRRKMRDILDQLELPDGFGFIVRTAGMERTKAELKRDLAYLGRLWKDIEKRWGKGGNKPRLLYSESDLLMRALRDMVTTDLDRIVIDDESAVLRAARFLKIVAPRTTTKLVRYTGKTPVFHAMGIEEQIRTMYSREVPLPSGGRLVIDETEALVAIDVNSGKMRDARDAETNAYRTNLEAAEEICRQLKLRDVGGIVVNDLIDMRSMKHRREIEGKFKELLKKDRARTTLETISDFGILEMTRQRMRGSYESVHFADCPMCRGRGLVQRPDSVATDAMRELAALLEHDRVFRIEMAVGPRIAGELLSSKRRALNRLERSSGKHVEVRVSESVPVDRVTFYCYDDRGADIDVARIALPRAKTDELQVFELPSKSDEDWAADPDQEAKAAVAIEPLEAEAPLAEVADPFLDALEFDETSAPAEETGGAEGDKEGGRGRRRRRGRGRGRGREGEAAGAPPVQGDRGGRGQPPRAPARAEPQRPAPVAKAPLEARPQEAGPDSARGGERAEEDREGGRRRRRRRRRRGRGGQGAEGGAGAQGAPGEQNGTPIFDEEGMPNGDQAPLPPVSGYEPSSWDLEAGQLPAAVAEAEERAMPAPDHRRPAPRPAAPVVEEQPVGVGREAELDAGEESEGPDGAPAPAGGDDAEGERRGRRRRRRRGGRGRGRAGEDRPEGAPEGEAPFAADAAVEAAEPAARPEAVAEYAEEGDAGPGPEAAEAGAEGGEAGADRGPRRRRRRGGRGRGRGDGGPPEGGKGGGGEPSAGDGGATPQGSGGGGPDRARGDRGRGDQRPRREQGSSNAVEPKPRNDRPPASPAPKGGAAPSGGAGTPKPTAPRVLYSSRRKLAPSERAKLKPE